MPPNGVAAVAPRIRAQSTPAVPENPIGKMWVSGYDQKQLPFYQFDFRGELPRNEDDAKRCAKAFKTFVQLHPSLRILPSVSGAALDELLVRSFQRGGVLYGKLAERSYTLNSIIDLSADATVRAQPSDSINVVPNQGPTVPPSASLRASPPVTFDLSKLTPEAKEQAQVYTRARQWIDAQVALIDRTKPATTDLATRRRQLIEMRDRFDRTADELAASGKPLRMKSISLLDSGEWKSSSQMTAADRAAQTMFDMGCIVARLQGQDRPAYFGERLICPASDGGIVVTTEFSLIDPWIRDGWLDPMLPNQIKVKF